MQIAPKNLFRYHGDGAQWNAGIGEIAYKKLGWKKAAIIMDDYSFGWTSAAGMIADYCAVGGNMVKRVFPPLNTTDYAPFVRQLPPPNQVDGYFSAVGGTGTAALLKAFEQAYGKLDPKQWIGNLFFGFLGADKVVAPKLVGSYVGGFGNAPGRPHPEDGRVPRVHDQAVSEAAGRRRLRLQLLHGRVGPGPGPAEVRRGRRREAPGRSMPRSIDGARSRSRTAGIVKLDSRRQAIQDQYQLQLVKNADGSVGPQVVAYVPSVDQSFGGLFKPTSPPPGRTQPPCKKVKTPWQGKIKVVTNGKITNQVIK